MKEFCFIAALILVFDCVFLFTSFICVLALKLELKKVQKDGTDASAIRSQFPVSALGFGAEQSTTSVLWARSKLILVSFYAFLFSFIRF